jgi:hypothetical protein
MKVKIFTLLAFFAMSQAAFAGVKDSIAYTPGYANDVYYSFKNGEVKSIERATWDIAFGTSKLSSSILINGGSGVELYTYPNGDTADWNSAIDTAGFTTWSMMNNSEDNWEEGAFSAHATNHPDYGWGNYNAITHNLTGDSLFIIKLVNGDFKKLWIVSKQSAANIYTYKFADLDGSNDTTVMLNCNPYDTKNYVYYSLSGRQVLDRDPASDSWDILFTKYMAIQPTGGYYPVTGVLLNNDVAASKVENVDTSFTDWTASPREEVIGTIGWDWKSFSMSTFSYEVSDSLVYFVQDIEGNVFKIVFTGFAGSSTGKVYFNKQMVSTVGVNQAEAAMSLSIYPNPANAFFNIELADNNSQKQISLYDLSGKLVYSSTEKSAKIQVNTSNLNAGLYFVKVESGSQVIVNKIIVQ